jgi:ABC-2 type transport system permease protein
MNSLRGLGELTWLELKIFLREPLGALGTIIIPVLTFVILGRMGVGNASTPVASVGALFGAGGVPVFVSLLIANSAVLSLITIVTIYREGGILKRLRATPLRPQTILSAHVIVKLLLTATTMSLMMLAGRRYYTAGPNVPLVSFGIALLISTWSILSIGFIVASIVPTSRFAQPIGALILYPMIGVSGLFVPLASLPTGVRAVASVLPMTYAVSLLQGIWRGEGWVAHFGDLIGLLVVFLLCTAIAVKVFRWE